MKARWEQISDWANEFGWTRGVELGVSDGRNLKEIAARCPKIEFLFGIDTWDETTPQGKTLSSEWCRCPTCKYVKSGRKKTTMAEREAMAMDLMLEDERIMLSKSKTVDEGNKWRPKGASNSVFLEPFDFVFVDGDHSTEGVDADINAWWRHLKPTGWMIGHDWNMASVRDGVLRNYAKHQIREADDHMWYVPGV